MEGIDSEVQRNATTQSALLKHKPLQKYLEHTSVSRHYFFLLRKCGEQDCTMCGPTTLPPDRFKELHQFPDPVPTDDGEHYQPFEDLWGKQTTEKHRPSLNQRGKTRSSQKQTDGDVRLVAETVRDFVDCTECRKPRCIYANEKLTANEGAELQAIHEEFFYVCGAPLMPGDYQLSAKAAVRTDLTCADDVERQYFSARRVFPAVCYCCGSRDPLNIPEETRRLHQTIHPVCRDCQAKGKPHRTRGKKRKHCD